MVDSAITVGVFVILLLDIVSATLAIPVTRISPQRPGQAARPTAQKHPDTNACQRLHDTTGSRVGLPVAPMAI
jgi:hypothetical protein